MGVNLFAPALFVDTKYNQFFSVSSVPLWLKAFKIFLSPLRINYHHTVTIN